MPVSDTCWRVRCKVIGSEASNPTLVSTTAAWPTGKVFDAAGAVTCSQLASSTALSRLSSSSRTAENFSVPLGSDINMLLTVVVLATLAPPVQGSHTVDRSPTTAGVSTGRCTRSICRGSRNVKNPKEGGKINRGSSFFKGLKAAHEQIQDQGQLNHTVINGGWRPKAAPPHHPYYLFIGVSLGCPSWSPFKLSETRLPPCRLTRRAPLYPPR